MKGSRAFAALIALSMLAWAGGVRAEDPQEGRVTLKIQASDPDGGQLFFNWVQKEGRTVKIADPKAARFDKAANKWISETYFIPTEPDTYVFEVTVRNENGLESTKRIAQEVLAPIPPPAADPGRDQQSKVGQKVVLSGQNSKANGNRTITKYEWKITEAPEGFSLQPEQLTSRQFEFMAKIAGRYVFSLRVNDGSRWSEPISCVVQVAAPKPIIVDPIEPTEPKVLPENVSIAPPPKKQKAIAEVPGGDKPFNIGDIVTLDGSKSVVNEGDTPKFAWKQLDIEKSPKVRALTPDVGQPFSNARKDKLNYPVQSFVASDNGIYKFVLMIDTTSGLIESEPVTFQVGTGAAATNDPPPTPAKGGPVAIVSANKTEVAIGDEVTVDGSKSSSPDRTPLTYIWSSVPGKTFPGNMRGTDGPVVRFSADREGEYAVKLVVSDGKKQGESAPVVITVVAADKPPVIELDPTQKCNVGEVVAMEAKIKDPQNSPLKIRWTCLEPKSLKIPEEFAKESRFRFTPRTPGTYLFQVEATNAKGLSAVAQTQIGVKDAAQLKPTAVINGDERATVGDRVTLSGAQSFSPNKKALTYHWGEESDRIKDPPPVGRKQEWTFKPTEPGRYVITLSVNDGVSDSEIGKFALDVAPAKVAPPKPPTPPEPPPPAPTKAKPVAKISGPKTINVKSNVELSAESSSGNGDLKFFWTQPIDGGPNLPLTASQRRGKILRFTPDKPGLYTITLFVVDQNEQSSDTETFTFEAKAAPAAPPKADAALLTKDASAPGKEVRMSAEKSSDPSGLALTYKWKQSSGLQQLAILPKDTAQEIVVTPSKPGSYEFQVVVNNGEIDSAPATVAFSVAAAALPQAIIAEIAPPSVGDMVVLDGSSSKSPNGATGEQLQYFWKQKPGAEPIRLQVGDDRKSKIQFVVPAEGSYVWELVVNDGNDDSPPAQITFTARPRAKNTPPIAVVERPVISTEVGVQTVIDASASNDPDKGPEPLSFRWRRGNNELKQSGPILTITPPAVGTLKFEVQAFDGKDFSEPVQIQVNVLPAGSLPVAVPSVSPNPAPAATRNAVPNPNNPQKGVIILDGTKSRPENKNLTYTWRQVGGDNLKLSPTALAKDRVGVRIYKPGDYKFELIVSDGENSSLPVTVDLKVVEDDGTEK